MVWNIFFVFILSTWLMSTRANYYPPPGGPAFWGYFSPPILQRVPQMSQQSSMEAMVDLTNSLGVAILQDQTFSKANFAFSPYGVASVLVVLYEGARGESALQIHKAVGFPLDKDIIRVGFRDIHRHLKSYFSHEGYLSGISLNKECSTLKSDYKRILRFYGYDVDLDEAEDGSYPPYPPSEISPSADNTTTITTTQSPTTKVVTTTATQVQNVTEPAEETSQTTVSPTDNSTQDKITTQSPATESLKPAQSTTEETVSLTNEPTTTIEPHVEEEIKKTTTETLETTTASTPITSDTTEEKISNTTEKPQNVTEENILTTTETAQNTTEEKLSTTTEIAQTTTEKKQSTTTETTEEKLSTTTETAQNSTEEKVTTNLPTTVTVTTQNTIKEMNQTSKPELNTTESADTTTETSTNLPDTSEDITATTELTNETTTELEEHSTVSTTHAESETTTKPAENLDNGMLIPQMGDVTTSASSSATTVSSTTPSTTTETNTDDTDDSDRDVVERIAKIPEGRSLIEAKNDIQIARKSSQNKHSQKIKDILNSKVSLWLNGVQTTTETATTTETTTTEKDYSWLNGHIVFNKPRKSRSVTDLKPNLNPDLSLQLQNGMYDSHVSRNADLYRSLPKLLFLVDGAIDTPVPMMTYTQVFPYAYIPRLHAKALEFPLDDPRYKLLILLPVERRGFRQLIYDLMEYPLRSVLDALRPNRVRTMIPTFMVEGFVILTSSLQKLGVWDVFDPRKADLSGMSHDPELYVRNVEQSVTVVIRNYVEILDIQTRTMAARYIDHEFEATHPFIYFVLDTATNVSLMAGQILDPLNSRIY